MQSCLVHTHCCGKLPGMLCPEHVPDCFCPNKTSSVGLGLAQGHSSLLSLSELPGPEPQDQLVFPHGWHDWVHTALILCRKKIPVKKWISANRDCFHHIFFFLINISWPVNQQSVILLIKKKLLQPIKYIYCPNFKVLIKDPSLMKIFKKYHQKCTIKKERSPCMLKKKHTLSWLFH